MKTFKQKVIDVNGSLVTVDAQTIDQANGIPAFKISATFGQTTVELTHTLAPIDGAHAELDPAHAQAALDDARARAARLAVLKENLRLQMDALE